MILTYPPPRTEAIYDTISRLPKTDKQMKMVEPPRLGIACSQIAALIKEKAALCTKEFPTELNFPSSTTIKTFHSDSSSRISINPLTYSTYCTRKTWKAVDGLRGGRSIDIASPSHLTPENPIHTHSTPISKSPTRLSGRNTCKITLT